MSIEPLLLPDQIDFADYFKQAEPSTKVLPASAFVDEVKRSFDPNFSDAAPGMPWAKTRRDFRLRDGEVTVLAGANGSGKSLLAGQITLGMIQQQRKALVISLEMAPYRTLHRMTRQASRDGAPSAGFVESLLASLEGSLWLYSQHGDVRPESIYGAIRYAIEQLGVRFVVVDNLAKIIAGEDSYNEQKNFLSTLTSIAVELRAHIVVVHHLRKGSDEYAPPSKYDLKGTGAIADLTDNVLLLHRNKKREHDLKNGDHVDPSVPHAQLLCCKQRNAGGEDDEPHYNLWFHRPSQQFVEDESCRPVDVFAEPVERF